MNFLSIFQKKPSCERCVTVFAAVLGLLISACGQPTPEKKAQILPVDSLNYQAFSLVSPQDTCASLEDFVQAFSNQYVPDMYKELTCSKLATEPKTKLSFSVQNPENPSEALGKVVVYQSGKQARFLVCLPVSGAQDKPNGTYCVDASSTSDTRAVPSFMKTNETRVHDFIVTLADYLLK